MVPVASVAALELLDKRRGRRQLAREEVHGDALAEGELEISRALLSHALGERAAPRARPIARRPTDARTPRSPAHPQRSFFGRRHVGSERVLGLAQDRHRCLVALAEERRQPVEQQVDLRAACAAAAAPLSRLGRPPARFRPRRRGVPRTPLLPAPPDTSRVRARDRGQLAVGGLEQQAALHRCHASRRTRSGHAASRPAPAPGR